jgi:uncharacterized membrane protein
MAARSGVNAQPVVPIRIRSRIIALVLVLGVAATYYAACSLLIHYSFHSFGWDLGLFDQLLWNLSRGNGWEYSFREMSYLGDHFQPLLLVLVPLVSLDMGPVPLLVVQAIALTAAAIPLFASVRALSGERAAWLLTGTYLLSLPVLRTVNYDFHVEAFIPLFAFSALWGLVARQPVAVAVGCLALLTVKEDTALLVLALCWLAWLGFKRPVLAAGVAASALGYAAVVSLVVMPHYLGDGTSPMTERYGYLGDSASEILVSALTRPDLLIEHLARWEALGAATLILAGVGFVALARPWLALPLVVLMAVPMLAEHPEQSILDIHYGIAPMVFALCVAVVALPHAEDWVRRRLDGMEDKSVRVAMFRERRQALLRAELLPFVAALAIFVVGSPLPPSFGTYFDRFWVDEHSQVAQSFVHEVPEGVRVSAQATFVPHLARRRDIYEFPRVVNATYVLLDDKRRVPYYDTPGFGACESELAGLGFELVREGDGIRMYRRATDDSPGADSACD